MVALMMGTTGGGGGGFLVAKRRDMIMMTRSECVCVGARPGIRVTVKSGLCRSSVLFATNA
jgi:hypothetical protein